MARINSNIGSLIARHNLNAANADLSVRLHRLSSGLRINRGADDPAGLIISERLRSEIQGVGQAIDNAERASNVIATTEAALAEVATLLNSIKGLIVESANTAGMSREEIEANQLQVDDAIASITRIANTTTFAGLKLLNGSLDYITSGVVDTDLVDVDIFGANFGTNTTVPVSVEVMASAQTGSLFLSAGTVTGELLSSVSIEVMGSKGVETFSFISGTALSAVMAAVNRVSDSTGVSASLQTPGDMTSGLVLTATEYGSDQFVSVQRIPGSGGAFFATYDAKGGSAIQRDTGEDVLALVNGSLALGEGTTVKLRSSTLNTEIQLSETFATALGTTSFSITGGGATFQLGPVVESSQQVSFGIQSVSASRLGNPVIGFLDAVSAGGDSSLIAGEFRAASAILEQSITQVSVMRGRLGAFERNTLQTNIRSLQTTLENVTASESRIRDADFAEEVSALTRAQVLTDVGQTVLAIANNSAQQVLGLLQ